MTEDNTDLQIVESIRSARDNEKFVRLDKPVDNRKKAKRLAQELFEALYAIEQRIDRGAVGFSRAEPDLGE